MNLDAKLEKAITQVVEEYPDDDWVREIQKRVPDADIGAIQEYIMIHLGGDVIELDEDYKDG